ncbi:MAG TPA: VanZ family protein [Bacillota bacterium]|nr:VanZ family protein [Bacillota bacterium]HPE38531.1 VanZ family protein [Bacillota bacterium]
MTQFDNDSKQKTFHPLYLVVSIFMWLIVVAWMAVIFSLSSETGVESANRAASFATQVNQTTTLSFGSEVIRLAAHVFEYTILAGFSYIALFTTNHISKDYAYKENADKKLKTNNEMYISFTLWIVAFFAVSDEYHQLFVNGREGSVLDCVIDFAGPILLMVIIRIIVSVRMVLEKKKNIVA